MSASPRNVILFQNGNVAVFDANGEQICNLQGRYEDAVEKLKATDLSQCQFELGVWCKGSFKVSEAEFFDSTILDDFMALGEAMRPLPTTPANGTSSKME